MKSVIACSNTVGSIPETQATGGAPAPSLRQPSAADRLLVPTAGTEARAPCPRCGKPPCSVAEAPHFSCLSFLQTLLQRFAVIFDLPTAFFLFCALYGSLGWPLQVANAGASEGGASRSSLDDLIQRIGRTCFQMGFNGDTWSPATRWKRRRHLPQLSDPLQRQLDAMVFGNLLPHGFHLRLRSVPRSIFAGLVTLRHYRISERPLVLCHVPDGGISRRRKVSGLRCWLPPGYGGARLSTSVLIRLCDHLQFSSPDHCRAAARGAENVGGLSDQENLDLS